MARDNSPPHSNADSPDISACLKEELRQKKSEPSTSLEKEFCICNEEVDKPNSFNEYLSLDEQLMTCAKCLDVSSFSYSTMYQGSGEGSRYLKLKENVIDFLNKSVLHRRQKEDFRSDLSPMIYICGRPGTGKVRYRLL